MAFRQEPVPERGARLPMVPGVSRIVAPNPSVMTCHGTNTYLIEDEAGGLNVLDPGPPIAAHVEAVLAAGAGRIRRIFVSHTHGDHFGAADELRARTGAETFGWHASADAAFTADCKLQDGQQVAGLTALFTPGHAADHLCFAYRGDVLFTADHVMGWASSIVNPPKGNMRAYLASLQLLLTRSDRLYLCGHGPMVQEPQAHVRALLDHRIRRELAIARAVAKAPATQGELMNRLYSKVDPTLRAAAERNVLAHLLKLREEGTVELIGEWWTRGTNDQAAPESRTQG